MTVRWWSRCVCVAGVAIVLASAVLGAGRVRGQWVSPPSAADLSPLGVDVQVVRATLPGTPPVAVVGLRLIRVYEGLPASRAGLEAGDILIQVNGRPVSSLDRLREALAASGGRVVADVVDVRTSRYVRLPEIVLASSSGDNRSWAPAGGGLPLDEGGSTSVPYSPVAVAPGMAAPGGEEPKGEPKAAAPRDGAPTSAASAGPPPSMPRFPWPPPAASDRTEIPVELLDRPGVDDSYYDVGMKLTRALREAGYDPISYYWVPGGFAIVTRLEQFGEDGTPLADPRFRWSNRVAPPRVFGLRSYLQALFTAAPGRFRVIVLVVTAEAFRQDVTRQVTEAQTEEWLDSGLSRLPTSYRQQPYTEDSACTALIYEFLKDAPESQVVLRTPGLPARVHLEKSMILGRLGQR